MCSSYCPCTDTVQMTTWITMSADDVVAQGRPRDRRWYFGALSYAVGNPTGVNVATANPPIVDKKFSSFKQCADYSATNPEAFTDEAIRKELYYYSNTKGENPFMEVIEFLEDQYDCAGLCRPELFFVTKSIDAGKPKIACGEPVAEEFGDALGGIGGAGIIASIMLFLSFLSSYCLWKKYEDE